MNAYTPDDDRGQLLYLHESVVLFALKYFVETLGHGTLASHARKVTPNF